jgi:hypothetical protein
VLSPSSSLSATSTFARGGWGYVSRISSKHNVLMKMFSFRRIDDRLLDEETSSTPEGYATPVEETKSDLGATACSTYCVR